MLADEVEAFVAEQVRAGVRPSAVDLVNDAWRAWSLQVQKPCAVNGELEAWLLESMHPSPTFAFREALRAWFSVFPEGIGLFWRSAIATLIVIIDCGSKLTELCKFCIRFRPARKLLFDRFRDQGQSWEVGVVETVSPCSFPDALNRV